MDMILQIILFYMPLSLGFLRIVAPHTFCVLYCPIFLYMTGEKGLTPDLLCCTLDHNIEYHCLM